MKRMNNRVLTLTMLAMMTALVFVSNYISIPTPTSRLHVANAVCLLAGMLFGGVQGAVAAGLGSALFDLTFPAYAAEAWITFINKGMMALVCGLIAAKKDGGRLRIILAAAAGQAVYIALYLLKSYIQKKYITPIPIETLGGVLLGKLSASSVNGLFSVAVAPLLYFAVRPALQKSGLLGKA